MATYTFNASAAATTQTLTSSFGVNIHDYPDTAYKDINLIKTSLNYLGFSSVRDGINVWSSTGNSQSLAAAGYKIDYIVQTYGGVVDLAANISALDQIARAFPGSIKSVEGANEVDYWPVQYNGSKNILSAIALQADLYKAVRSDSSLANIPVLNMTLANAKAYSTLGNVSNSADMTAVHSYSPYGDAPQSNYATILDLSKAPTAGKAAVVTEAGYSSAPLTLSGVDQTTQAKYSLNLLLDGAKYDVGATYLYELLDEKPDTSGTNIQQHYGLFNNDGTPKLAATAIHNLTTILNNGASASSKSDLPLSYSLTNFATTDSQLLLEKRTGVYDLALWAEPKIWDGKTQSAITASSHTVTVSFATPEASVSIYDPLLGSAPIQTFTNASSIDVSVSDHPLIVEVNTGANTPVTAVKPAIASYSTGTLAVAGGVSNASTIKLSGRGSAGSTVTLVDGTNTLGTTTVLNSGVWSFTTSALADGPHDFAALNAQNIASDRVALKIDATAPVAPTVSANLSDGTKNAAATNANVLTLQGKAEASSVIVLYDGTSKIGTTTAASAGNWTFTTAKLADGQHSFTATATDQAQNTSKVSQASVITVDTTAPKAPSINLMSADGSRNLGASTNQSQVLVSGLSEAGASIQMFDGTELLGVTVAKGDGTWSIVNKLSEGKHTLFATASDAAKNVSTSSRTIGVVTDYTSPTVSVTAASQDSQFTRVWGTAEAGATISLVNQSTSGTLATVTADKTGYWIAGVANPLSNLSMTIKANDAAGNTTVANLTELTSGKSAGTLIAQNNSIMTTNQVATNFAIDKGFANETISGFYAKGPTADSLQFSKSSFADMSSLMSHASQVGADTVIATDATHTLTLKGMTTSTLAGANIHFV